ncbi:MAG: DUF3298 and DUF4163 domain-containing protein [Clostridium sp.]|uniref:DUF3298 and DUF4163 domain-containing protein n=1 Tax=Clostridium sp. TaxID=1506 RepID=UPI002FCC864C
MKKIIYTLALALIISFNFNDKKSLASDNGNEPDILEITVPRMVNSVVKDKSSRAIVENEEKKYSNEYISVNINKPIVRLNNKEIEGIINNKISKKVEEFENYFTDLSKKDNLQYIQEGLQPKQYVININNTVNYNKDNILSLTLHLYSYTGGAHGSAVDKSYNFDLNTGNSGVIEDFLGKDKKYNKKITDSIKETINKNPNMYFKEITDNITEIGYNQKFFLTDGYIVVYFDEYEIAPYAAGIVQFKIPLSNFKSPLSNVNIKVEAPSIKNITYEENTEELNSYVMYPRVENMANTDIENKINNYFENQVLSFKGNVIEKNKEYKGTEKYVRAITTYFKYVFKNKNSIVVDMTYSGNNDKDETIVLYNRKYSINLNNGEVSIINEEKPTS